MNKEYKEYKKPNFLFRAIMIFVVAAMIVINIMLTYSANGLKEEIDTQKEELKEERRECEAWQKRLDRERTDETIIEEAKNLGYKMPDDILYEADIPNSK